MSLLECDQGPFAFKTIWISFRNVILAIVYATVYLDSVSASVAEARSGCLRVSDLFPCVHSR